MKKMIAMVLVLCMILGMVPVIAMAATTYYVAGPAKLCGVEWVANGAANAMSDEDGDGIYTKTYTNLPAGKEYEFKITDGTWTNNWGKNGNNYVFDVNVACDVTISFNSSSKAITVSGTGVSIPTGLTINGIYAVGAGKGSFLNGQNWNQAAASNKMTQVSPNVYQITYTNVAAGTYEFKFAANGAWTHSWGTGGTVSHGKAVSFYYNGGNSKVTISEPSNVTLELDLTNYVHSSTSGAKGAVYVEKYVEPTEAPTTQAPTTQAPTTEAPTTQAPTTQAPTTEAPVSNATYIMSD